MTEANQISAKTQKQSLSKKGQRRRQDIVNVAKKRLLERGRQSLSLREIASDMGITHGNLQYYFTTREDLLKAIFNDEIQVFTTNLVDASKQASSINGRIDAIIDASFLSLEAEETKLWRILIGISNQDDVFAEILKRENDFFEATLNQELETISPNMSPARRAHVAKLVKCMLDGFAVELAYADSTSSQYRVFKSEMRSYLQKLLKGE